MAASTSKPDAPALTPAMHHILLALLEGDRHGYAIMQAIEVISRGEMRLGPGTLYTSIKKLLDAKLSSIKEESGVPDWQGMVTQLVSGHETCARTARDAFKKAEGANDQPSADLATTRMQAHEKTAWMLRSLLQ